MSFCLYVLGNTDGKGYIEKVSLELELGLTAGGGDSFKSESSQEKKSKKLGEGKHISVQKVVNEEAYCCKRYLITKKRKEKR